MSSLVGQNVGRYRIVEEIGAGGMGVVYRAHDERLDRDLALKVLSPGTLDDPAARKRFRNEALVLSRLNHPAIQTIHDFETQDGIDFLISELVPGTSLDARIEAGPLPEREVIRLGVQLAQGLAAAHGEGVLHRDLKPANLRVTPDGRLKILDFGLATLSRDLLMSMTTATGAGDANGSVGGTLPYMSPEQLLSEKMDERSDIYSAGAVLYEMSTGRRAFPDSVTTRLTNAILHEHPASPASLNKKLSPELERIILKCLEKDPELRYQSAKELAADLRRMEVSSESRPRIAVPVHTKRRKTALALGIGAGLVTLVVAALAFLAWRATPTRTVSGPLRFEQITRFTDSALSPALSPDGKMVAFIRGPGNFGGSARKDRFMSSNCRMAIPSGSWTMT
jgi:serine/threonine protein kinase